MSPKRATLLLLLSGNALSTTTVSIKWKPLLQLLRLTLNNALRKNVPTNGPAARRILSAFLLSRNARKNAEPNSPAGNYASPKKETHLQPTSPSVLPKNTALENLLRLIMPKSSFLDQFSTLSSAAWKNPASLLNSTVSTTSTAPRLSINV